MKGFYILLLSLLIACEGENTSANEGAGNTRTGQSGSLARFSIVADYLYAINGSEIQLFNISDAKNPKVWAKLPVNWDIETLFPYGDNLFIGAETAVYIYDIKDDANPQYVSIFSHLRSCDPVVVEDSIAYVTLRSASRCGGSLNQLDVLNVSDIQNPNLIKSYQMENPYGLGVKNNLLWLCDGRAGLKIYNAANPLSLSLLDWYSDVKAYDVILKDDIAIVVAENGLYNFEYSNSKITLLSEIKILGNTNEL